MLAFVGDRLSENLAVSPEGYLIARNCVIARTAVHTPQLYKGSEIGLTGVDDMVPVFRSPQEVFSRRALASGEGKPLCSPHPGVFLSPANTSWYQRGHMQNLRQGDDELEDGEFGLLADLIITDESLIDRIRSGALRQVSLGYNCSYWPRPNGDGYDQRDIVINHAAIVDSGRAGRDVRIQDSMTEDEMDSKLIKKFVQVVDRMEQVLARLPKKTLADEVNSIVGGAKHVEQLTASGVGPASFAQALREHSPAYNQWSVDSERGAAFEKEAREAGERMRAKFQQPTRDCRTGSRVAVNDTDASWAERMNSTGKRMRS